MSAFEITIDGRTAEVTAGQTILHAARQLGLDIPTLCHLEKCGPLTSCQVCLVRVVVNGQSRLVPSCATQVTPGMIIESETEEVHESRRTALELLFSDHVGDCLSPCHRLCPLQLNIPVMLRHIQAGRTADALATVRMALPLAGILGRLCHHPCEQGCRRGVFDEPAAIREMERFLTENEPGPSHAIPVPTRDMKASRSAVIVGGGPTGLTAAHDLARNGYAVTVIDRNPGVGGALRKVNESDLPAALLASELGRLAAAGVKFKAGVELGRHVTMDGLQRGFDVVLLAMGEFAKGNCDLLGLPMAGAFIKVDPATCQTSLPKLFAAGSCVKPIKQLVRAMAEGRAAAECIHRHLRGQLSRRPEKPFSSIIGRLEPGEMKEFLRTASPDHSITPCSCCATVGHAAAAKESARCLHCDCRSSGQCALQHYAQVYGADANRFRSERRRFTQQILQNGLIFEPGKCIQCGICVRLAELAGEPMGLSFIGRGFAMQIAAPFGHTVGEGISTIAEECVRQCPTGALALFESHA